MEEGQEDFRTYKYIIYARKSTTDETRQVRSIPDQISDCLEFARRNGLRIIGKPLLGTKSAKIPNKCPVFDQMLKDISTGKFDGILAWNPDRLARNMLEGGKIIDMIDNDIIKDLKFVTHHFTKDANGKMLLGMAFVLSKQYSDDLSQKVTRGVRKSFEEGKSAIPKHGYYRDENGYYRPDGKNFELIKEAWDKRLSNRVSLEFIADEMNKNGYARVVKSTGRKVIMDKRILSDIFRDPIYYGVLVQANQQVDLREIYDFVPAVSEEDYFLLQRQYLHRVVPYRRKRKTFYPFKQMVICSSCNQPMRTGASKGNTRRYLFFRCGTKGCSRFNKSTRAKVVLSFIYDLLDKGLNFTEAEYQQYYKEQLANPEQERFSVEQFLNLSKRAAGIVKAGDAVAKDTICRIIFLNFTTDGEKVLSYQAKDPFATLLKGRLRPSGRGAEN